MKPIEPEGTPRLSLEEERGSRRMRMEMLQRPAFGWSCTRNTILFLVLCLEWGGVVWCTLVYLPRIEASYQERIEPRPLPAESAQIFELGRGMGNGLIPVVGGSLLLIILEGIALATRRWPVFDTIYFVGIVVLALSFLYAYISLALPLSLAGSHPPTG